ncbi:hypothetical protein A2W24_05630 [Microgenomates group bacterium RBG_16_45_19]|nr:MAG: hypothetical protein A2W24_05630 [Microgenomates group bacterium RBG_16_45_19]
MIHTPKQYHVILHLPTNLDLMMRCEILKRLHFFFGKYPVRITDNIEDITPPYDRPVITSTLLTFSPGLDPRYPKGLFNVDFLHDPLESVAWHA